MDGQPTFLILVLTIVALMQIQGHRPIMLPLEAASALQSPEQPMEISRCNGIELDTGCAMQEMWDVAPPSRSP